MDKKTRNLLIIFVLLFGFVITFFQIITTVDSDKGLTVKLPPMPEKDETIITEEEKHNVLNLFVNAKNELLINNQQTGIDELKKVIKDFVNNKGVDPQKSDSPEKAKIILKNDVRVKYSVYISIHNALKAAYFEMWDEESQKLYQKNYEELNIDEKKEVRKIYPYKIEEG